MDHRYIDAVFEGGGARGLALNGGVAALEAAGYRFNRVVGTSAGAITATLVAAGYSGAQIEALSLAQNAAGASRMTEFIGTPGGFSEADMMASILGTLLRKVDLPFVPAALDEKLDTSILRALMTVRGFANVYSLLEHGGFYSADGFLAWLREQLDADGRAMSGLTYAELFARTGRHLSVVVTDVTRTTFLVLNHVTAPQCPVLWGVRMSMSIPFFWPEVTWQPAWGTYQGANIDGNTIVDGGLVSNFPLRLLVSDEAWIHAIMGGPPDPEDQVLGLWLDERAAVTNAPPPTESALHLETAEHSRLVGRLARVISAATSGNDLAEAFSHPKLVCRLPTAGYGVTEFNMSPARIEALMSAARAAMRGWIAQHDAPPTIHAARQRVAQPGAPQTAAASAVAV